MAESGAATGQQPRPIFTRASGKRPTVKQQTCQIQNIISYFFIAKYQYSTKQKNTTRPKVTLQFYCWLPWKCCLDPSPTGTIWSGDVCWAVCCAVLMSLTNVLTAGIVQTRQRANGTTTHRNPLRGRQRGAHFSRWKGAHSTAQWREMLCLKTVTKILQTPQ